MQPITGAERVAYNCREINIEIAKVQAFKTQVAEGAQFNMASVLGILGDTVSSIQWSEAPLRRPPLAAYNS